MAKNKVLICDSVSEGALAELKNHFEVDVKTGQTPEQLIENIGPYNAVVVRSATKVRQPAIEAALKTGNLKVIVRGGVGIDNIDAAFAREHGIEVMNTPAASSVSVAELAFGLMLACARHIGHGTVSMKKGEWLKKDLKGVELYGKTLGIIGYGRIGREIAMRAEAFGMTVIAHDAFFSTCPVSSKVMVGMDELLKKSDFITLHIPFDKARGASIGPDEFKKMKKGVILVNAARGGTVDEKALLAALNDGTVYAAGLDVFEKEPPEFRDIIDHPKVVTTPHIGASTVEAQNKIGAEVVSVLRNFFGA
jgi:D-3-phosphoglycerate dehydrogenase / 2-oxoglutarate reductase